MVAFFIAQRLLRQNENAKSFHRGAYDRGTLLLISSAVGVGMCLPPAPDYLGVAPLPIGLAEGAFALAIMLLGIGLRLYAAISLGGYYTATLRVAEGQRLVDSGPYSIVRHPGYLGKMLIWAGFGVASGNLVTALLDPAMIVVVSLYRVSVEERMLVEELGEDYVRYRRRTRRVIPLVY